MLNKLVPITLITAFGFGIGTAVLAETTVGTVAGVSAVCDTITLTDGTTFAFDDEAYADRLGCFEPGDEVSITWRHVGDKMEAIAISPVSAACVKHPGERLHECTRMED